MSESYKTIEKSAEGFYREKGSRFLSFAYPVASEEEAELAISRIRKEYHDARHHCYAYCIGEGPVITRWSDDGEPAHSAGQPILGQIKSFGVTNILVVVVRYFGGTLLGVGGLIRAYKSAASDALSNADILTRHPESSVKINFAFENLGLVMKILDEEAVKVVHQQYADDCTLVISCRRNHLDRVVNRLYNAPGLRADRIDA